MRQVKWISRAWPNGYSARSVSALTGHKKCSAFRVSVVSADDTRSIEAKISACHSGWDTSVIVDVSADRAHALQIAECIKRDFRGRPEFTPTSNGKRLSMTGPLFAVVILRRDPQPPPPEAPPEPQKDDNAGQ